MGNGVTKDSDRHKDKSKPEVKPNVDGNFYLVNLKFKNEYIYIFFSKIIKKLF